MFIVILKEIFIVLFIQYFILIISIILFNGYENIYIGNILLSIFSIIYILSKKNIINVSFNLGIIILYILCWEVLFRLFIT
mgnify:CR=1 FL=1